MQVENLLTSEKFRFRYTGQGQVRKISKYQIYALSLATARVPEADAHFQQHLG